MASIREAAQQVLSIARDGIGWIFENQKDVLTLTRKDKS